MLLMPLYAQTQMSCAGVFASSECFSNSSQMTLIMLSNSDADVLVSGSLCFSFALILTYSWTGK